MMTRTAPLPPLTVGDIQHLVFNLYTLWVSLWVGVRCVRGLFSRQAPAWSLRLVSRTLLELLILSLYGVAVLITWPSGVGVAILLGTDIGRYSSKRWLRRRTPGTRR